MITDTTTTREPDVSMTAAAALSELERLEQAKRDAFGAHLSAIGAPCGPPAPLSMRADRSEAMAEAERELVKHWSAVSQAACRGADLGSMDGHVRSLLISAAIDAEHCARQAAAKYAEQARELRERAAAYTAEEVPR